MITFHSNVQHSTATKFNGEIESAELSPTLALLACPRASQEAESVCHSVSAFFQNKNKTNFSSQIFNQTFYFLLAFKAFAKEKNEKVSSFCRKFKVFKISEVIIFRYEFVGNVQHSVKSNQCVPISVCQLLDFYQNRKTIFLSEYLIKLLTFFQL